MLWVPYVKLSSNAETFVLMHTYFGTFSFFVYLKMNQTTELYTNGKISFKKAHG